jgi:tryptophanyl-tRNA synthetase
VFNQSAVHEHAELAWLFNCVARVGWLNRMTQFKDKAGKNAEAMSVGLYAYPDLMAADILLYLGTHVPVGEDQKQHLELTRDIAQKFNNDFAAQISAQGHGEAFFPLPEPLISGPAMRVMSLRDGTRKMSKSEPSEMATIYLGDTDVAIADKIKKARTDPEPLPGDPEGLRERPEARNLVEIFAAVTGRSPTEVLGEHGGGGFGAFKPALAEAVIAEIGPVRDRMRRLLDDRGEIDRILADGAGRARAIAAPVLAATKAIFGLLG